MDKVFICNTCNKTFKLYNKVRHENSKNHISKIILLNWDCPICLHKHMRKNSVYCKNCKQYWCDQCHQKLGKCPYCRTDIEGNNHILEEQKQERMREYEQELIDLEQQYLIEDLMLLSFINRVIYFRE